MSKPAGRLGDMHSGHSCFPPTNLITASGNVIINGRGAMRKGDMFQNHCCPFKGCHPPILQMSSSTVKINGRGAGRMGDMTACKATVMFGSLNVLIGG